MFLVLAAMAMHMPGGLPSAEQRLPLDRVVSDSLGQFLPTLAIRCVKSAAQNAFKSGGTYLVRGREDWNEAVQLLADGDKEEAERAFWFMAQLIALTARPVPPLPRLDVSALNWRNGESFFAALLKHRSGGAYEQYAFAALKEAFYLQRDDPKRRRWTVRTKDINAADKASKAAADVEFFHQSTLVDAWEVTGRDWSTGPKLRQVYETAHRHRLPGVTIVAPGARPTGGEVAVALRNAGIPESFNLAVVALEDEIRSLLAQLGDDGIQRALTLLYEHLRNYAHLGVGQYVDLLVGHGLTVQ
jgi:hypothetical protein